MHRSYRIGLYLLIGAISTTNIYPSPSNSEKSLSPISSVTNQIQKTIQEANAIPGLQDEEFSSLRTIILTTWNSLLKTGCIEITGKDADIRPSFVAIQAIIEHTLSSLLKNEVSSLTGIIHTPMPATPLCTKGEISSELVAPSILEDKSRLLTVKARTTILRDFLAKEGTLYVVYPKDGVNKRTETQQQIYREELKSFASHLFDVPLNCEEIPSSLIGATYFFTGADSKKYTFSIRMTQAKDPNDTATFALWFGDRENPLVNARVNTLESFLSAHGFQGAN